MKQLVCEMCGGTDLIKQDGVFVCQHCGVKYTVEEARKMMVEGVVNVQGTVTIDRSGELELLYRAARNARETSDDESAVRHYENISARDPNSWEALFYLVVLKTNSIKNSEIQSSAVSVSNCLPKVFSLIKEYVPEEADRKQAVWEVTQQCFETATWLTGASHNFYKTVTKGNGLMAITGVFGAITSAGSTLSQLSDDQTRCAAIANIMAYCGNQIEEQFDMADEDYRNLAVWSWSQLLAFHEEYQQVHKTQTLFDTDSLNRFNGKIAMYSGYTAPESNTGMLTVYFDSTGGSFGMLLYTLNGSEQFKLRRGEQRQHYLEKGGYTLAVENPMMKRTYDFWLDGEKVVCVYGKSFGVEFSEQ